MPKRRNDTPTPRGIAEIATDYDRVALVFQGGGALGAYQGGVYQALAEAGCEPTWLSGVSIGAINAAIIAGNHPADRLDRLAAFWRTVSHRKVWAITPDGDIFRELRNRVSSWITMTQGQPGFFKPRVPSPWLRLPGAKGATSLYDTSDLKATLERLIDFDLLNDGNKRLSVGAVNVRTGNYIYFDTQKLRLTSDHIMASGALPPALPAVRIEGECYWDGGIVSNTPLQYLLEQEEDCSSLVFQIDLFSARGDLPRSMTEVLARQKDITYSSRTRQNTDTFRRVHGLKMQLRDALRRIPADQLSPAEVALIADYSSPGVVNIIHLIYQQKNYEGTGKDYEFSDGSMREHWDAGYEDTVRTLRHRQWLARPTTGDGVTVHDLHREDPT